MVDAISKLKTSKTLLWLAEDDADITLIDDLFNANYSFEFQFLIRDVASGYKNASQVQMFVNKNKTRYPLGTFPLLYTSNHDVNSWDGTVDELFGDSQDAMNLLIFTIPGMPMVYSGQEVNNNKRLEFFEKDEINWDNYEDHENWDYYKQLIALRKNNLALSHLEMDNVTFLFDGNENTLCFVRENDDNKVVILVNLSNQNQTLEVDFSDYLGNYVDYFGNVNIDLNESESFVLEPWGYKLFVL